jgi:heme/copper-type cytochrome/quinol oxidase subunit 2
MKYVLYCFLVITAMVFLFVATAAFLGVLKARKDKGKTDDDMATGALASVICWMLGGLFIFLAYLAS